MKKAVAINGSPQTDRGYAAAILGPLITGMIDTGCKVEPFYASRLNVKACTCGEMYCWYRRPGECCIKDDMEALYPKLKQAQLLVLTTPVYIPLRGAMQNVINRLCPLAKPLLETRAGRRRAKFQADVRIRRIALVSTGSSWEKENFDTVVCIAEEFAENGSVPLAGAVLRTHAFLMKQNGEWTQDAEPVLAAVRRAGDELIADGEFAEETLEAIRRPLISEHELRRRSNELV